jgi:integrase
MLDQLKNATPGQTIWDRDEKASVKGLHVRVREDGTKAFLFYYRTRGGTERRPRIGTLGEITLAEARRRAKLISDRVAVGEDPKGQWEEAKEELIVRDLFDKTRQDHWDQDRYRTSGWLKQVDYLWRVHLKSTFGSLKLSEVTPSTVRKWHNGYTEAPYSGNRALSVLSKCFQHAEELEIRRQHSNPCLLVKPHPEVKRDRYASEEEIKRIAPILERLLSKYPAAVSFLYLLIYTGARPRSIERAAWDELKEVSIDGEPYGILTFDGKTTKKTGKKERVILPPQAMKALNRLPRIEGYTITGIKMPRHVWRIVKEEAGVSDLWVRDWRRTFATVGMSGGVGMDVIGELLNHRSTETTKIYAKLLEGKQISSTAQIATRMEALFSSGKEV